MVTVTASLLPFKSGLFLCDVSGYASGIAHDTMFELQAASLPKLSGKALFYQTGGDNVGVQRGLKNSHPLMILLYFTAVMACAMFFLHPLYGFVNLTAAFAYSVFLKGKKAAFFFPAFSAAAYGDHSACKPVAE